jgi:hypothetical protein
MTSESPRFHVSPTTNRESILAHGLDWTKMHPARRGIACGWVGQPEEAGIYLTNPEIEDARFFVTMGGGRDIDVWQVDVTGLPLIDLSRQGGWWLCSQPISPERLTLVEVWKTDPSERPRRFFPAELVDRAEPESELNVTVRWLPTSGAAEADPSAA